MNFIANETAQKLRGGFYTDPDIASFLARWVLDCLVKELPFAEAANGVTVLPR
jgi:adenine-specific DNA-methyltransferase